MTLSVMSVNVLLVLFLFFKNDPTHESRTEDAIIAWTWNMFIENNGSDPEILLRMPMTKVSYN